MTAQRKPGPLGVDGTAVPLDDGTLQLCATPTPGPVLAAQRPEGAPGSRKAGQQHPANAAKPADTPKPEPTPEDRVLEALPERTRDFVFAGRNLRLIRRRDWRVIQLDERYQVVPADDARGILQSLAATTVSRTEKAALGQAVSMLPVHGITSRNDGLLLLRVTPVRYSTSSSSAPAMTPSQIARSQVKERHWIEIQLVDEDRAGIPGVDYAIITPDNQQHSGTTGEDGVARLEDILPGQCKISFPKLDRDAWRAA
jgi:hypothetical protein